MDLVQILADLAVAVAQQAETAKRTQTRQQIETLYQKREAGYLKEQQDLEQFVQNAQSILETAAREWNDLRVKALSALEQADQDQLLFRDLALAKERQRLQEHIARWNRDLEDLCKRDPIDGEKLLDGIQLVLDIAGFIPVLGAGPDVINTIISVGRGNWGDAAINAIAIIPFWGDAAKGGKMLAKAGREGVSHVDEISAVVNAVAKHSDKADEIIEAGTKAGAEALHILGNTCFAVGTPILTPNGSKKIEEFQIGDLILTRPEHSADSPVQTSSVEEVFRLHANILEVRVSGRILETTSEHPFFVVDKGWVRANALQPGDLLLGHDDHTMPVESVTMTERDAPVFNVRVAQHHTYFVGAEDWEFSVWVHNAYSVRKATDGTFEIFDDVSGEIVASGLHKEYAHRLASQWTDLANGTVELAGNIIQKVTRFRNMSSAQKVVEYQEVFKTFQEHLTNYGQTAGRSSGETLRMEQELWHFRLILEKMKGFTFGPNGELLKW